MDRKIWKDLSIQTIEDSFIRRTMTLILTKPDNFVDKIIEVANKLKKDYAKVEKEFEEKGDL